jgi:hypothetical protein
MIPTTPLRVAPAVAALVARLKPRRSALFAARVQRSVSARTATWWGSWMLEAAGKTPWHSATGLLLAALVIGPGFGARHPGHGPHGRRRLYRHPGDLHAPGPLHP